MCEWRKSVIFPEYYSVSDDGQVRSERNGKILKPALDKYGYYYYVLCVKGDRRTIKAHRLVALTFISNPENKPTVNHKNGVRIDNRVCNLEWATNKEQTNDPLTYSHLINALKKRDMRAMGAKRNFGRKLCRVYKDGILIAEFSSQKLASDFTAVSAGKVSKCVATQKTCKGYSFS